MSTHLCARLAPVPQHLTAEYETVTAQFTDVTYIASVEIPLEGTPNFETVVKAYEAHAASGDRSDVSGSISVAPKGTTFLATTGKVCYLLLC